MAQIETFQDGTIMGTFSQIKLDDGNKILISLTPTEITIFKVGFWGSPKGTVWKENLDKFLDIFRTADSNLTDKSALELAVQGAATCKTISEVEEKFKGLKRIEKINDHIETLHQKKDALQEKRRHLAEKADGLIDQVGDILDQRSEMIAELGVWQESLKIITKLLADSFNVRYKTVTKELKDFLEDEQYQMDNDQEKELMILSMMGIVWSVYSVFTEAEAKDIIDNFKTVILDKYFPDSETKVEFEKCFFERWDEYAEVLGPKNENIVIQTGRIFCDHFFGTRRAKGVVMGLIGMSFLSSASEIKKSLEKIRNETKL